MEKQNIEKLVPIREFYHHDQYRHYIDINTDKIYLVNVYDLILLTYGCNGSIHTHDQICSIGRTYLKDNYWWYKWHDGVDMQSNYTINDVEGLLDLEVELSKQWLDRI